MDYPEVVCAIYKVGSIIFYLIGIFAIVREQVSIRMYPSVSLTEKHTEEHFLLLIIPVLILAGRIYENFSADSSIFDLTIAALICSYICYMISHFRKERLGHI